MTARSCSGRGRLSCGSGCTEGAVGAETFHDEGGLLLLLLHREEDVNVLCADTSVSVLKV